MHRGGITPANVLQWLLKHANSLHRLCLVDCAILRETYFHGDYDKHGCPFGRAGGGGHTRGPNIMTPTGFLLHENFEPSAAPCSSSEALPSGLKDNRYLWFLADGAYFPCTDHYGLARAGREEQWKED